MKTHILDFVRRGLVASGFGPPVLAVLYLILHRRGLLETVTVTEVSTGIFSLWALAFLAGGMNALYQIERLPLMVAIAIHGGVLYSGYLATYEPKKLLLCLVLTVRNFLPKAELPTLPQRKFLSRCSSFSSLLLLKRQRILFPNRKHSSDTAQAKSPQ